MTTSIDPVPTPVAGQLALIEISEPGRDRVERALAGYLAGYSGATLIGYRLDLRQWVEWISNPHIDVVADERAQIELYARCCESDGKARSTIGRRLSTICGFYRYCEQERITDHNPAAHVRPATPVRRRLKCLLSLASAPATAAKQRKTVIQATGELIDRQRRHPSRGELDRQRDAFRSETTSLD